MVHFIGRFDDGRIFATSHEREPLEVTVGDHEVIPTLEEALTQMQPGDERTITIPVDRAYGPRQPELVMSMDRTALPQDMPAQVGQRLQVREEDGQLHVVTIASFDDDTVILDGNHPLAGENLTFQLRLVEIRTGGS
jgi:peptidylprolyl isomerase